MHPPAPDPPARFGVGIDTSRHGHHAAFLRHDLSDAADEMPFPESADGYQRFRERLALIASRAAPRAVHFAIRLDAAGQYADNLPH